MRRWETELTTGGDGRFAGALWEPGVYNAGVRRERAIAPHLVDVHLTSEPVTIDVPDRLIAGRVGGEEGKPLGAALVVLQSQRSGSTLMMRTQSAPDGRFEFFGVREGEHSLFAPSSMQLVQMLRRKRSR